MPEDLQVRIERDQLNEQFKTDKFKTDVDNFNKIDFDPIDLPKNNYEDSHKSINETLLNTFEVKSLRDLIKVNHSFK